MDPAKLIEAIPLPCVLIGPGDWILAANTRAESFLGQGLVGRSYIVMMRQPRLLAAIEETLRDQGQRQVQYTRNEGNNEAAILATCAWISQDEGAVLVSFEDLTQVEQAGQMRRDFVANVSHELRTPLTSIMGFIETLRGPARDDPNARERFLSIMSSEAARMNRLVGDLLSLSRVESDERLRPTAKVSLPDVLQSTLHSLRPVAAEAGMTLELTCALPDVQLTGDFDQLIQVFTNLIENAIKYASSGKTVQVTLEYTPRDAGLRGPAARVQVIDKGPGIEAVHLPRLTERFYRADSHRSRELGGTGLGLAIVKHIISRHRGRMRVKSDVGQGSVFTVTLPCDPLPHGRDQD